MFSKHWSSQEWEPQDGLRLLKVMCVHVMAMLHTGWGGREFQLDSMFSFREKHTHAYLVNETYKVAR